MRPARPEDAERIAAIYNQGIEDRVATFETAPRSAADVAEWLATGLPVLVAERDEAVVRGVERGAEAYGARVVGVERESEWAYGGWQDTVLVEILASDFPPHPATEHLRSGPARSPLPG